MLVSGVPDNVIVTPAEKANIAPGAGVKSIPLGLPLVHCTE